MAKRCRSITEEVHLLPPGMRLHSAEPVGDGEVQDQGWLLPQAVAGP